MATTHSQASAQSKPTEVEPITSFALWEGGRREASREGHDSAGDAPVLVLAHEADPLPLDFAPTLPSPAISRVECATSSRPLIQRFAFLSLCLLTALIFIVGTLAEDARLSGYRSALSWEPHVVTSGETLRSLLDARELPPVESGRLISWVEDMNDLPNATIYAGQTLLMPQWQGPNSD